jgi:ankyrin repeat protein
VVLGGNTALTLAARQGHVEAARALLAAGAKIDTPSAGDKTTPLVTAICNGHFDLARFLLDRGADPNRANVDGLTPLYATIDTQWAPVGWAPNPITDREQTSHIDLLRRLLVRGAKPNVRLVKKLWFRPTHHDECWIGTVGATPFWRAAQGTDLAAMKLLIAWGADPKIATIEGVNALMVAAGLGWNGNFSVQGPDSALETVRYCLELGLDPTPQDVQGYTALCGAAYRGDNELVRLLHSRGARVDTRNARGWSVTDMANGPSLRSSVPVKHPETVALLLELGAPPLTNIDNEEILGIIRTRPPVNPAGETPDRP